MISVEDAQNKVIEQWIEISGSEQVHLLDSLGRVVSKDVLVPFDQPPFSNSAMDGYALQASNTQGATPHKPVSLEIKKFQSAGSSFCTLEPQTVYQIGTGAPLPEGADAVVMKEHAEVQFGRVILKKPILKGENVRSKGENLVKGIPLFMKGQKIQEKNIGLLASCGFEKLSVLRKPRVCHFATGDEIVSLGQPREDHQIYNSNAVSLETLFKKSGCEFDNLGICKDDPKTHLAFIEKAKHSKADMVVITGGVSVGRHDFVKSTLMDAGAEIIFHKVAMKPGKPILFARLGEKFIFGLPGNPLSAQVGFYQFIYPAIQKMLHQKDLFLKKEKAFLLSDVKSGNRHKFLVGFKKNMNDKRCVIPFREGSGNVASFSQGDCFISVPIGAELLKKGSEVEIQSY